ncbi:hypothetical protein [Kitasatospora sp. McL0602]|uniref:hypothetical protein n=1 Tax=Kitasatospora sp. McL0602 TaxID=3439530 RepID=UPI003F8BE7A0
MRGIRVAARAALVVLGSWAVLVVLLVLPGVVFPTGWQWYIYSPASVGLWMLSLPVVPLFACKAASGWINPGRRVVTPHWAAAETPTAVAGKAITTRVEG